MKNLVWSIRSWVSIIFVKEVTVQVDLNSLWLRPALYGVGGYENVFASLMPCFVRQRCQHHVCEPARCVSLRERKRDLGQRRATQSVCPLQRWRKRKSEETGTKWNLEMVVLPVRIKSLKTFLHCLLLLWNSSMSWQILNVETTASFQSSNSVSAGASGPMKRCRQFLWWRKTYKVQVRLVEQKNLTWESWCWQTALDQGQDYFIDWFEFLLAI